MALFIGPRSGSAAGLQIRKDVLLPVLEALLVHEFADLAVFVVADHFNRVVQVVQVDGLFVSQTLVGWYATRGYVRVMVLHNDLV